MRSGTPSGSIWSRWRPIDLITHAWPPRRIKWAIDILGMGALTRTGIRTTEAFGPEIGETLPGRPIAVPTPGHTGGHCSYIVDGVLVSGDALITGHPALSRSGPQLLPGLFNHNQDDCVRSLAALALVETDVLVPGHGDLWIGPIRKAAEMAGKAQSLTKLYMRWRSAVLHRAVHQRTGQAVKLLGDAAEECRHLLLMSSTLATELPSMPRQISLWMSRQDSTRSGNALSASSHSGTSRRARQSA